MNTSRWQNALLPGELRDDSDGGRSARDWIVDLLMYAIAFGVGVAVLFDSGDAHSDALMFVDIALGMVCLVSLWWRRSHPGAVGTLAALAGVVSASAAGPGLVAGFNVALRGTRQEIIRVIVITAVAIQVYPRIYDSPEPYLLDVFIGGLIAAIVISWGLLARVGRQHVLELRERATRTEAEQRLRLEQARDAERRRIAREMHDVLAHRVSLLALHAGALEFRRDASAEEVAEATGVIRATAQSALEELREVIGVLRDGSEEGAPEPPQPTLVDVPALVEESRAAGMRVRCTIEVDAPETVPAALGRTVYRIVQEGLTNARKHAPAAAVDVTIAGSEELVVEVVSRRPVGVAVAASPLPGSGSGLIGLGERVALAGGELRHGPDAAGDFVLRATLPRTP
jgi:signal transduction histidine kinase